MPLAAGQRFGPYEVVALLGAGGMGEVYRAQDERLGRDVALKFLSTRFFDDPAAVERFMRESRAASALNHPHIVTIYDIGDSAAGRFIVMELVEGRTLRSLVAERPPVAAVARVGEQIAKALAAAHLATVAARNALEIFANREAALLARHGIELLERLPAGSERIQQELALQVCLAGALQNMKGYGAIEVEEVYARARELCHLIGETIQLFPVLAGLWVFYLVRAEYQTALELADQCLHLAQHANDPALLMASHLISGDTRFWLGEFLIAREHLERGLAIYERRLHRSDAALFGWNDGVLCRVVLAAALWHLGYPDQALKTVTAAVSLAQEMSDPLSLGSAQAFAGWIHQLRREARAAQDSAAAGIARWREQGMPYMAVWGAIPRGSALALEGKIDEAIAALRQALADWQAIGSEFCRPWGLALLADVYGKADQPAEGLTVIAEALMQVERTGERYYEAEAHRLKGELLFQQTCGGGTDPGMKSEAVVPDGVAQEAEACFRKAIDIAVRQQAKSLELRATTSFGTRLGPHEVIAPLGAGGMGQVYRARPAARPRRGGQDSRAARCGRRARTRSLHT